jgi:uncharacterized membrane protein YgcG
MSVEIKYVKKNLPCIATTIKNGETLYLLDNNNNLVFCTQDGLISMNFEYIRNCFDNDKNLDLDKFFITTSLKNDCINKVVEIEENGFENPTYKTNNIDKFLANEVIINGEILNKYNLSDISLNKFEETRLFGKFIFRSDGDQEMYNKLNKNEKKRLACTLYYYYITEKTNFTIRYLPGSLDYKRKNLGSKFDIDKSIKEFYIANRKSINSSFEILTDFKKILNTPVKETGGSSGGSSGGSGGSGDGGAGGGGGGGGGVNGVLIGSIIGVLLLFGIVIFFYFRNRKSKISSDATSVDVAADSTEFTTELSTHAPPTPTHTHTYAPPTHAPPTHQQMQPPPPHQQMQHAPSYQQIQHAPPPHQQMHPPPHQQMHPPIQHAPPPPPPPRQQMQPQQHAPAYKPNCNQDVNSQTQNVFKDAQTHKYPNIQNIVNNFYDQYYKICKGNSIPQRASQHAPQRAPQHAPQHAPQYPYHGSA